MLHSVGRGRKGPWRTSGHSNFLEEKPRQESPQDVHQPRWLWEGPGLELRPTPFELRSVSKGGPTTVSDQREPGDGGGLHSEIRVGVQGPVQKPTGATLAEMGRKALARGRGPPKAGPGEVTPARRSPASRPGPGGCAAGPPPRGGADAPGKRGSGSTAFTEETMRRLPA